MITEILGVGLRNGKRHLPLGYSRPISNVDLWKLYSVLNRAFQAGNIFDVLTYLEAARVVESETGVGAKLGLM